MGHLAKVFKFNPVQEGFIDKLGIFDPPKQETSVVKHDRIRFYPKTAVKEGSPIVFLISGNHGGYIDGSSCTMTVKMSVKAPGGADKVTTTDKVALVNQPLTSVFSQVQLNMNGTEVNPGVGSMYANKNYIETLIGFNTDCLLYTSPSPRDKRQSRMPSSA